MTRKPLYLAFIAKISMLLLCARVAAAPMVTDDGMSWCGADWDTWLFREPVVATSRLWIRLDDFGAAADRFLDFAAFSALTYSGDANACDEPVRALNESSVRLCEAVKQRGWKPSARRYSSGGSEDNGFAYSVWEREDEASGELAVVIAFRGTDEIEDWYANFRPITRLFTSDDQYTRSRDVAEQILDALATASTGPYRIYLTGHSLGGGLAQHVLYSEPTRFAQAIVFNSSPVTGYLDFPGADRRAYCRCDDDTEPRIYRISERGELLGWARGSIPLTRNTYHVSLNLYSGNPIAQHSMTEMAIAMLEQARAREDRGHWIQDECLAKLREYRKESCSRWDAFGLVCPR
jgi:pimeloyl-ACP methyl ester carboxylesterase